VAVDVDETRTQGCTSEGHGFKRSEACQAGTYLDFGTNCHDASLVDSNCPIANRWRSYWKYPLGCVKDCHARREKCYYGLEKYVATHSLPF
jgi:hypothetical protein